MRAFIYLGILFGFFLMLANSYAYYNITSINTTLILNTNQSAHVVEQFIIYISNTSISTYQQNKDAIGLTLSDWQKVLYSPNLEEHILGGSGHSFYNFELLPGPLITVPGGGYATMTMNYYVKNVTSIQNIAPRKFEYNFNTSVFNFEQGASGQILPSDVRLNFIIPKGAEVIGVYPLPDYPKPNFIGNYSNITEFSWYTGEPLSQFSFNYVITESPETEVLNYLQNTYINYGEWIYLIIAIGIIVSALYIYKKGKSS